LSRSHGRALGAPPPERAREAPSDPPRHRTRTPEFSFEAVFSLVVTLAQEKPGDRTRRCWCFGPLARNGGAAR
jgi:hypothetical protein